MWELADVLTLCNTLFFHSDAVAQLVTYMIASETGLKGTNTMIIGIAVYIIIDIPYTYLEASVKLTGILAALGILIGGILFFKGVISQNDFFYVLIALLAFWIMSSTFQNGALNEQLVKQRELLTGLFNRRYAGTVLEESVNRANKTNTRFAVYCIDLNNFKPVNDFYGHDMGDNVLREFGQRMLALESDYISFRTDGDEFMIVKNGITGDQEIEAAAVKLRELFNTPVKMATYVFRLSGSIGAAVYPGDSEDPSALIRYADAAMYSVKHSGHKDGYRLFDRSLVESVEKHKALETMLKNADPARDFELFYQPRFRADSGELIGAEAFLRLKADETLTAAMILPIAEEVGLMNRLNIWIVKTGIRQLNDWNSNGDRKLFLSLNLSALQLLDQGFIDCLKNFASDRGIHSLQGYYYGKPEGIGAFEARYLK